MDQCPYFFFQCFYVLCFVCSIQCNFTSLRSFGRKLIEGEDSRLSTMVRNQSLTGGLRLTSSVHVASGLASDSPAPAATSKVEESPSGTSSGRDEKAPGGRRVEVASSDTQTDCSLEEQATKKTERKTVLIR